MPDIPKVLFAKAKVIGTGTPTDPFRVNLPTYQMVGDITAGTVDILIPQDEYNAATARPDKGAIRRKYKGQSWDRPDVSDDT